MVGSARRVTSFPIRLAPSSFGLPAAVTVDDLSRELDAAARAWSFPAVPCTSVAFEVGKNEARRLAVHDGIFRVVFRSKPWCHNERCGHRTSFPTWASAMTTLYPESGDGPIVEADIELNGLGFVWATADTPEPREPKSASLRGVLVHELGHVLGLRDACPESVGDSLGLPSDCDSVMLSGDRIGPTSTDVRWLCAAYPREPVVASSAAPDTERSGRYFLLGIPLGALATSALFLFCVTTPKRRRPARS